MSELRPGERMARALHDALRARVGGGLVLSLEGGRWKRELRVERGARSCRVLCSTSPESRNTVVMGMGNAHLRGAWVEAPLPERFPEHYQLELRDDEGGIRSMGHTGSSEHAVRMVLDWVVEGCALAEVYELHPCVDRDIRRLRELAEDLAEARERHGSGFPMPGRPSVRHGQLWMQLGVRAVRFERPRAALVSAALVHQRTSLVRVPGMELERVLDLAAGWLAGEGVEDLGDDVILAPGAAAFLRGEQAAWHWGVLGEDPESHPVHRAFGPFLEAVARSERARHFYVFTQLSWLRFSRCSHHPFDTAGCPTVYSDDSTPQSGYQVEVSRGVRRAAATPEEAVRLVEACLDLIEEEPWYGDADRGLEHRVSEELARAGSTLRGERRYRATRSWVVVLDGERVVARVSGAGGAVSAWTDDSTGLESRLRGSLEEVVGQLTGSGRPS